MIGDATKCTIQGRCVVPCRNELWFLVIAFVVFAVSVSGQDTDGDGLLDLIDVQGFRPDLHGEASFESRGIEDLDGANLLTGVQSLILSDNLVASIENGDFTGLTDLKSLSLSANRLTSVDGESLAGLISLKGLNLSNNQLSIIETGSTSLSELSYFDLRGNRISSIELGDFGGQRFLQTLWLSEKSSPSY